MNAGFGVLIMRVWAMVRSAHVRRVCVATTLAILVALSGLLVAMADSQTPALPSEFVDMQVASSQIWTVMWLPANDAANGGTIDIVANRPLTGPVQAIVSGHSRTVVFTSGAARIHVRPQEIPSVQPPPGVGLLRIDAAPASPLVPTPDVLPGFTATPSASPTLTPTPTVTAPATATPSTSASPTSVTGSPSASPTPSASPSAMPTYTPTATAIPAPTPNADIGPGSNGNPIATIVHDLDEVGDIAGNTATVQSVCGSAPLNTSWAQCLKAITEAEKNANPGAGGANAEGLAAITAEEQQILNATGVAGYTSQIVDVGGTPIVVARAPTGIPAAALQPGDSTPIIFPGTDASSTQLPVVAPGCTGTVLSCTIEEDPAAGLIVDPAGATFVDTGSGSGLVVPAAAQGWTPNEAGVLVRDAPSGYALTESGIAIPDAGNAIDASRVTETASAAMSIPSGIGDGLSLGGKILGGAGVAVTGIETISDLVNGNWTGAGLHGIQTGVGIWFLAGGGEWLSAGAFTLFSAALPPVGAIIVTFVAVVAIAIAVNWMLEWLFGDLFAPDIYIDNSSGQDVHLNVTLPTEGAYDVVPAWHGGTWSTTVAPDGVLTLPDGSSDPYLHYELLTPAPWQRRDGWIIKRSDFAVWAQRTLPQYGFDQSAVAGFVGQWASLSEGGGDLVVYPQSEDLLARLEPLSAKAQNGSPVSVRRVWFVFAPATQSTSVVAPSVTAPRAAAIDVQEWGVFLEPGADKVGGLSS